MLSSGGQHRDEDNQCKSSHPAPSEPPSLLYPHLQQSTPKTLALDEASPQITINGLTYIIHAASQPVPHIETADDNEGEQDVSAAVRFASANQEISPDHTAFTQSKDDARQLARIDSEHPKEVVKCPQGKPLQQTRTDAYQFEPVSLPASRVS